MEAEAEAEVEAEAEERAKTVKEAKRRAVTGAAAKGTFCGCTPKRKRRSGNRRGEHHSPPDAAVAVAVAVAVACDGLLLLLELPLLRVRVWEVTMICSIVRAHVAAPTLPPLTAGRRRRRTPPRAQSSPRPPPRPLRRGSSSPNIPRRPHTPLPIGRRWRLPPLLLGPSPLL